MSRSPLSSSSVVTAVRPRRAEPRRWVRRLFLVLLIAASCSEEGSDKSSCALWVPDEPPCWTNAGRNLRYEECYALDDTHPGDDTADDDSWVSDDDDSAPPDDDTTPPVDLCPDTDPDGNELFGACNDDIDNNNNGCCDGADPICEGGGKVSEEAKGDGVPYYHGTPCNDGWDNDGDGLLDCFDPDCRDENGVPNGYLGCEPEYYGWPNERCS